MRTESNCLLVTNPANIRYLTGFVSVEGNGREAYLLKTKNELILFTNSLYIEKAGQLKLKVVEISADRPISARLNEELNRLRVAELEFEEYDLKVAELAKLRKKLHAKLVPTSNQIESLRVRKNPFEIGKIRAACRLTDSCFSHILKTLKPGVSERDITWEIESYIRRRGAGLAFPPIVAVNDHASQPHFQEMDDKPLAEGSLVLLDFGARVGGYRSDMTRVVFIGHPQKLWLRAYRTVLKAQQAALDYLNTAKFRSGAKADSIARGIISEAGFTPYPHSLGHNVGLDIHESPRLTIHQDADLLPGMVFSVEPGIYVPGRFGIRIEDLVHLRYKGLEILTKSSKKLIVL